MSKEDILIIIITVLTAIFILLQVFGVVTFADTIIADPQTIVCESKKEAKEQMNEYKTDLKAAKTMLKAAEELENVQVTIIAREEIAEAQSFYDVYKEIYNDFV